MSKILLYQNVYAYDFKTFEPVPLGLNSPFKNVRCSTTNDENKYKSKDHLFISKTTVMVNTREKIYCMISIFDKRLSSFSISLILCLSFYSFSSFFPIFFVLILSYLSGACTFFFADIFGRTFLSSFGHF